MAALLDRLVKGIFFLCLVGVVRPFVDEASENTQVDGVNMFQASHLPPSQNEENV